MIIKCTRGFGLVEHPETGEQINVEEEFETDRETFELLNDSYPGFEIVAESEDTGGDSEDIVCGVNDCSRSVESPDDTCWQH